MPDTPREVRIHLLPETLANQIAAGEVVERPASAVKELVENALDAGARRIEVDLQDGGCRLVRVRDDGSGMGREDALLSLQRHATSKLRTKDDLFAISTYGFRGEALPSIAAVSRFTLLTCEPGAGGGTRIEVEGGRLLSVEDAGAPPGTTVEARDLFWNVPARRKFLKRAATEQAHAVEAVLRLALPRPEVEFTVRESGRVLLRLPAGAAAAVQEQRAEEALGREVRGRLLPVSAHVRGVRARGLPPRDRAGTASRGRLPASDRCRTPLLTCEPVEKAPAQPIAPGPKARSSRRSRISRDCAISANCTGRTWSAKARAGWCSST